MSWVTSDGPFFERERQHGADDWFECNNQVVTDSTLAEAAFFVLGGEVTGLVTINPSDWLTNPVRVLLKEYDAEITAQVPNYWNYEDIRALLEDLAPPIRTWLALEEVVRRDFPELSIDRDAFAHMRGVPFNAGAAGRLRFLLGVLHQLATSYNEDGTRREAGDQLLATYFTGGKALFTDSSPTEKQKYSEELSFQSREETDKKIWATWHGKVKTPQLRVHFSDPFSGKNSLEVFYVGPKITKK
ncbi:MAG: hypothetical protein EOP84_01185 [Verrucomicrobiaceae bacterium]|nr:MAG: hypothetical protein EOP84_01185 [Verrucomicrobiaceae bacterium]